MLTEFLVTDMSLTLHALQQAIVIGGGIGTSLIILGIIIIIVGALGKAFLPTGGQAWYIVLVMGVVVFLIGIVLLFVVI